MRHPDWNTLVRIIDREIVARYGGKIHDPRCGKTWDPGQAVCAEMYGPDWNTDPRFLAVNTAHESESPPREMLFAAHRLADGECDWAEEGAGRRAEKEAGR